LAFPPSSASSAALHSLSHLALTAAATDGGDEAVPSAAAPLPTLSLYLRRDVGHQTAISTTIRMHPH
jgi:hypothetical protein